MRIIMIGLNADVRERVVCLAMNEGEGLGEDIKRLEAVCKVYDLGLWVLKPDNMGIDEVIDYVKEEYAQDG